METYIDTINSSLEPTIDLGYLNAMALETLSLTSCFTL